MEEGGLYSLGLVGYKVDEVLVCYATISSTQCNGVCNRLLTFQESLDVVELAGVVKLPKVLGLLREILALCECVSLVCDNV